MEEELGVQLLIYANRNVQLTPEGQRLRRRAQETVNLMDKTQDVFQHEDDKVSGQITLGAGETQIMREIAKVGIKLDRGLLDFGLMFEPYDPHQFDDAGVKEGRGTMLITQKQLLEQLAEQISDAERAALEDDGRELVISRYNRATVLKLLSVKENGADYGLIPVEAARVDGLKRAIEEYLDCYMPGRPEGHKWIILSCLFLTFIAREPMHPQEIVHWERLGDRYQCPSREMQAGSLCRWCVCGQDVIGGTGPFVEQGGI